MLISDKQHEANIENAKLSTGPVTPEGKAAVRLNALTYGLRARQTLLPDEDPEDYKELWDELVNEWEPQGRTERLHLEQMCIAQWLLIRMANSERQVTYAYMHNIDTVEKGLALLERIAKLKAQHQRAFAAALHELENGQAKRRRETEAPAARPKAPAREHQTTPPFQHDAPYLSGASATDTR